MKIKKIMCYLLFSTLMFFSLASCSCSNPTTTIVSTQAKESLSYEVAENGKFQCFLNGPFLKSNVIIWYTGNDGNKIDVTMHPDTVFHYSTDKVGITDCDVTYKNLRVTFQINVVKPQMVGIDLQLKTDGNSHYLIGDIVDRSNYLIHFYYEDGSTSVPSNIEWYLLSSSGEKLDADLPIEKIGVYLLYAKYNEFYDFEEIIVGYPQERLKTFDDILLEHPESAGRYHVDEENLVLDDTIAYKVTVSGLRTFIENKDESGQSIKEPYNDYYFTSRLTIASVGSLFQIEVKTKLRFEINVKTSDERTPFVTTDEETIYFESIAKTNDVETFVLTLEPGVYNLSSANAGLYIYSYVFIEE